jgi:hypothetical protein
MASRARPRTQPIDARSSEHEVPIFGQATAVRKIRILSWRCRGRHADAVMRVQQ